ncbi:hypothetical protein Tco_1458586 [Tanacetum coccineum]
MCHLILCHHDSESEDEEVDGAPEATIGTITQKPYDIHRGPLRVFWRHHVHKLESSRPELPKRLAETETKLAWARMERDIAERRLHESRVWNKMFYLDMVRFGVVPKPPSMMRITQALDETN